MTSLFFSNYRKDFKMYFSSMIIKASFKDIQVYEIKLMY